MKVLLLVLLMSFVIMLPQATAEPCTPPAGFDWCYENQNINNNAWAIAKVWGTERDFDSGPWEGKYVVGDIFANWGFQGDKSYIQEGVSSINWNQCNENGCSFPTAAAGRYVFASKTQSPRYPMFISWDYDESGGSWAWTAQAGGWWEGTWLNQYEFVDCYANSNCQVGEFCDRSSTNPQSWSCEIKECENGQDRCTGQDYGVCENNKWVNKGRTIGKCGVDCTSNTQCEKLNGLYGDPFCDGKTVLKQQRSYFCSAEAKCDFTGSPVKILECSFKCEEGQCIDPPEPDLILPLIGLVGMVAAGIVLIFMIRRKK